LTKVKIQRFNQLVVLTIIGKFFTDSINKINEIWNKEIIDEPDIIAINCEELELIDSGAIGTLVQFLKQTKKMEIEFLFFGLTETIKMLFETTGLINFFTILSKEEFYSKYKNFLSSDD